MSCNAQPGGPHPPHPNGKHAATRFSAPDPAADPHDVAAVPARLDALAQELGAEVEARLDERVGQAAAAGRPLEPDQQEAIFGQELEAVMRRYAEQCLAGNSAVLGEDEEFDLKARIRHQCFGYAGLQPLLEIEGATEIRINGPAETWIVYPDGTKVAGPPVAPSVEALRELIRRVAAHGGDLGSRPFDLRHPIVDIMLPDGSRFNAIDYAGDVPYVTIRRHTLLDVTWDQTAAMGMVTPEVQEFLAAAVRARCQILVGGPTGVGKTTLVRAMCDLLHPDERLVVVESERELRLPASRHRDLPSLQSRPANIEGVGELTMGALVHNALRMGPDRILVSELRGPETLAWLWAIRTGHRGSLSTIHADSARGVFDAIALHGVMNPQRVEPAQSLHLAVLALDLVVFMDRDAWGKVGHVASVHYVDSLVGTEVKTTELFGPGPDGRAVPRAGIPHHLREQLVAAGFDPAGHQPLGEWLE
ncbi:MAG: Flp pilus assembly complex ATPase component TadA [Actinobacteria bacterium]|nr:Flp pilus assembly complex ATPase component TadA [Actinomycetota bacterium]